MAEINIEKMAQSVAKKSIQELRDNGVFIGRWIPVSEGLPEKNGNYLITYCYRNEYCHRNEIETDVAAYVYDEDEEEDKWFDITDIEITLAVKAWMPLPEPYKVESEK